MPISTRSLSIRTKLSIGFAVALAVVVAAGLLGVLQLRLLNSATTEITGDLMRRVVQLDDIERMMGEQQMLALRREQTTDDQQAAAVARRIQEVKVALDAAITAYAAAADMIGERSLFVRFAARVAAYENLVQAILRAVEAGRPPAEVERLGAESAVAYAAASDTLDELVALARTRSGNAAETVQRAYREAVILHIVAIAFVSACFAGAIVWATRSVSRPLLRLSAAMRRIGAGDRAVAIEREAGRMDEIGVLAAAAKDYRDSLERSRQLAADAERQRRRFELAVDGMPIGLAVFDRDQRLIICNRRYGEMYGLGPELLKPGTAWESLVRERVRHGKYVGPDPEGYIQAVTTLVTRREPCADVVEFQDGRLFSINFQPTEDGGWVSTHEDVTDQHRIEARITHLTRHDPLTDLPNRAYFHERIDETFHRVGAKPVVLCLDLDRFRNVNETLGHPIGDLLLKAVADRLRHCVRDNDLVARIGGDEFAVLQSDQRQPTAATMLAQRIVERLGAPFMIGGHQIIIGASVGIAMAPADGDTADRLLKSGDQALNRAKGEGGGAYRFFEPEMDARMRARRALELDLRQAMIRQEFELHYQPIVSLARNRITGFEALIRWMHPERGVILPDDFIPLAEEIGLIVPLGEWVLRRACGDAAAWPKDIKVAVNLSPVQFRSGRLLQAVITALAASGLPGNRLELEITETVLLDETIGTVATLHQLRGLGVRVCMDDFGIGYSSLGYLRSFPFDKIKIDRSFIHDLGESGSSLAILRAVAGLGASLGMTTTAEGVETTAQYDLVKAEGCDEAQGTFIGEPAPVSAIAGLLDRFVRRDTAAA